MIVLEQGGWRLAVRPELGCSIASLTCGGRDVLRPTPEGAMDILQTAFFPLVPYANRIAGGRFSFGGQAVALPVHDRFAPHALHGDGWLASWALLERSATSASFVYRHDADGWPWPYEAVQTFTLSASGLRIDLSVLNVAGTPAPAGLGLHPYFPVGDQTRLQLRAEAVCSVDAGLIPTAPVSPAHVFDWSAGPRVADAPFVDSCYIGWGGTARLIEPDRTITVTGSPNAGWAHIYAPGLGYCCVEPVTHRPDAVHAPEGEASGLVVLEPGRALSMWMEIAVADA
ncbi:MAG: aldose 1-epimerase [Brevundimonas sp.]|uniref:aldose 1-epimerase n=1 Tax=Brevundimonas sp. TaxID=1871086 RepID=UPI00391D8D6D